MSPSKASPKLHGSESGEMLIGWNAALEDRQSALNSFFLAGTQDIPRFSPCFHDIPLWHCKCSESISARGNVCPETGE